MADCLSYGVNTIFVYAFSPVYGRYYYSTYPEAWPNSSYGKTLSNNFLAQLLDIAHHNGIKVVASFPLNQFQGIATNHPDWQSLNGDGTPFTTSIGPDIINQLCVWHPGYRNWYQGLIQDVVTRYPSLDGIEACEGNVNPSMNPSPNMPDHNPAAVQAFNEIHPGAPASGDPWQQHRADGMSGLHQLFLQAAHTNPNIKTYVVNGLVTVFAQKNLMTFQDYALLCGYDWQAVGNLGFNFAIQEAMWQQMQWNYQSLVPHPDPNFYQPGWTSQAVAEFASRPLGAGTMKLAHVEVTPFVQHTPVVITPSPAQFQMALTLAFNGSAGTTVYSYSQLKLGAADNAYGIALRTVYRHPDGSPVPMADV